MTTKQKDYEKIKKEIEEVGEKEEKIVKKEVEEIAAIEESINGNNEEEKKSSLSEKTLDQSKDIKKDSNGEKEEQENSSSNEEIDKQQKELKFNEDPTHISDTNEFRVYLKGKDLTEVSKELNVNPEDLKRRGYSEKPLVDLGRGNIKRMREFVIKYTSELDYNVATYDLAKLKKLLEQIINDVEREIATITQDTNSDLGTKMELGNLIEDLKKIRRLQKVRHISQASSRMLGKYTNSTSSESTSSKKKQSRFKSKKDKKKK